MRDRITEASLPGSLPSRAPADQGAREQGSMDRGSEFGSPSTPTSSNASPEPATVDEPLIDSSAASPAEPAPSLRPVEELQALCDAATAGPWRWAYPGSDSPTLMGVGGDENYSYEVEVVEARHDGGCGCRKACGLEVEVSEADAVFIAAARTALPSLLARLRAAEETLAIVREWAFTKHGGVKTPAEVWPGLAAALTEGASR